MGTTESLQKRQSIIDPESPTGLQLKHHLQQQQLHLSQNRHPHDVAEAEFAASNPSSSQGPTSPYRASTARTLAPRIPSRSLRPGLNNTKLTTSISSGNLGLPALAGNRNGLSSADGEFVNSYGPQYQNPHILESPTPASRAPTTNDNLRPSSRFGTDLTSRQPSGSFGNVPQVRPTHQRSNSLASPDNLRYSRNGITRPYSALSTITPSYAAKMRHSHTPVTEGDFHDYLHNHAHNQRSQAFNVSPRMGRKRIRLQLQLLLYRQT